MRIYDIHTPSPTLSHIIFTLFFTYLCIYFVFFFIVYRVLSPFFGLTFPFFGLDIFFLFGGGPHDIISWLAVAVLSEIYLTYSQFPFFLSFRFLCHLRVPAGRGRLSEFLHTLREGISTGL